MVATGNGVGPFATFGQVQLDSTGYGTLRFAPVGTRWSIASTSVSVSSAFKEATCKIYRNLVGPVYLVDTSVSGSTGDVTDTNYDVLDGEALIVEWSGGDANATATCRLTGTQDI